MSRVVLSRHSAASWRAVRFDRISGPTCRRECRLQVSASAGSAAGTLSSGWTRGCSADTDGLSLRLDHDHDALLPSGVGRIGVLGGQLVDDLPRRITLEPFDDPPTDDNGLERVVHGRDGQRHPRVAAQVACLARARTGEEDDSVAGGAGPDGNGMGRAVWEDGGEVSDRGAVEYAANVGVKHVC